MFIYRIIKDTIQTVIQVNDSILIHVKTITETNKTDLSWNRNFKNYQENRSFYKRGSFIM